MNPSNDQRKLDERYLMMTQAPVKRLILKMSVPTIISMLVTSIYNMVVRATTSPGRWAPATPRTPAGWLPQVS